MRLFKKVFTLTNILIAGSTAISTIVLDSCSNDYLNIYLEQEDISLGNYIYLDKILSKDFISIDVKFENQDIEFKSESSVKYLDYINYHENTIEISEPDFWGIYYHFITLHIDLHLIKFENQLSFQFNPKIEAKNLYIDNKKIPETIIHLPPVWIYLNIKI